jgi:DNA-binding transcriptional MerR regulator
MEKLNHYKQMPPCPAEALVSLLGDLLPRIAGHQERYKVTEVPSIRTLRFYVSQGLVDKPLAYEGRTALYGYRHLLQVVVIKVLQANHFPLRKIREMLQELSTEDLERLLEVSRKTEQAGESEGLGPPTQVAEGSGLPYPLLREFLTVKLKTLPGPPEADLVVCAQSHPGMAEPPAAPLSWRRLEVEPGVELHLREDITVQPGSRLEVLLARIKHLLHQQGQE